VTLQRLSEGTGSLEPPIAQEARLDARRLARQGRRNAQDGLAFLRAARGMLEEVIRLLTRAKALVEEARSKEPQHPAHAPIQAEFQTILATLGDLGHTCQFNGSPVFTATEASVSLGEGPPLRFTVGPLNPQALGLSLRDIPGDDLDLPIGTARDLLSAARASVQARLTTLEATMALLASSANRLGLQMENLAAIRSPVLEPTTTEEIVNLTRFQTLQQSTLDAQGQISHASQEILVLLRCGQSAGGV